LVAAFAEGPMLQSLDKTSNVFKKKISDLTFEVEKLERELSLKNPNAFMAVQSDSNVKKAIFTEKLRCIQQQCMLKAKLAWMEQVEVHNRQLNQVGFFSPPLLILILI
jgi:hypothetical protein